MPGTVDRKPIERFAGVLPKRLRPRSSFTCLVTTDAELRRLNRSFRRKDYATDVLSFPAHRESGPAQHHYLGDLAISWQCAREQAAEFGHSVETEIQILMLHGFLHLLELDHETDDGKMQRVETHWRRVFGLPGGLIERVSV